MMTFSLLSHMKLGGKLAAVGALFAIPIGLLAWLFISQTLANLAFNRAELGGTEYLQPVWDGFLHAASGGEAVAAPDAALLARLRKASAKFDAAFGSGPAVDAFLQALEPEHSTRAAIEAGEAAIRKISDASNLFLDPDLDSIYLMDTAMHIVPQQVMATHDVHGIIIESMAGAGAVMNNQARLQVAIGQMQAKAGPMSRGYATAFGANADGTTRSQLEASVTRQAAAVTEFLAIAAKASNRITAGMSAPADLAAVNLKFATYMAETDVLWKVTNTELTRLVQVRVDRLQRHAVGRITVVLIAVLLAIGASFLVVRSVRRPISELLGLLDRLRGGDAQFVTPHTNVPNETGDIARGLEVFRRTVSELDIIRRQREALQAEEAARARDVSELALRINDVVLSARDGDFTRRLPVAQKAGFILELSKGMNELTETVDRGLSETVSMMAALAGGTGSASSSPAWAAMAPSA